MSKRCTLSIISIPLVGKMLLEVENYFYKKYSYAKKIEVDYE